MASPPPDRIERLTRLVRAGGLFVLTGAGVSTDSGIPDYRGPDGVNRANPMLHGEFVGSAEARSRYWARSYVGWPRVAAARPNGTHRRIARWQADGLVGALVTQNVDRLHHAAGSDAIELHGALEDVRCLDCGHVLHRGRVQEAIARDNPRFAAAVARRGPADVLRPDGDVRLDDRAIAGFVPPACPVCVTGRLKPDVVFFGDGVPRPRVEACFDALTRSRVVLVLGSSLAVMSGYRFVKRAVETGKPVAIVTRGWCRGAEDADLLIDGDLSSTLTAVDRVRGTAAVHR